MKLATAQSVLTEMVARLPPEHWWQLRDGKDKGGSVCTAFNLERDEIDSLLVNAGLYKRHKNGFALRADDFHAWQKGLPAPLRAETIRKQVFVANGTPADYRLPGPQIKAKVRNNDKIQLPQSILDSIRESLEVSDQKDDDARKELSKIVDVNDEFNLSNPSVEEWAQSALTEIVQLYKDAGSDMHVSCDNGRQRGILPVPKSKDYDSFVAMDVNDRWIERMIEMSVGENMTMLDGINCMRRRLDAMEEKLKLDHETVVESDVEHEGVISEHCPVSRTRQLQGRP